MKGTAHAVIGAASTAGAALVGTPLTDTLLMAGIAMGASLGPDIDNPRATISQRTPRIVHKAVHLVCAAAFKVTASGKDKQAAAWKSSRGHDPYHRTLTHTGLSTAGAAWGAYALAGASWGVTALLVMAAWWSIRFGKTLSLLLGAAIVYSVAADPLDPVLAAWAAGAGWLSHILADACTKDGVPLMWPIPIAGRRWWRVRLLGTVLASGSPREWFAVPLVIALMNTPVFFL